MLEANEIRCMFGTCFALTRRAQTAFRALHKRIEHFSGCLGLGPWREHQEWVATKIDPETVARHEAILKILVQRGVIDPVKYDGTPIDQADDPGSLARFADDVAAIYGTFGGVAKKRSGVSPGFVALGFGLAAVGLIWAAR